MGEANRVDGRLLMLLPARPPVITMSFEVCSMCRHSAAPPAIFAHIEYVI